MPKTKLLSLEDFLLEGEFELLPDANLLFIPHASSENLLSPEGKIVLNGTWEIDKKNDLRFKVSGEADEIFVKELIFQGEFLRAEAGELDFTYQVRFQNQKISIRTFRFFGKWEADQNNRLTFTYRETRGLKESLTLNGAWKINKKYQIVYTYQKEHLKTKIKNYRKLVFNGYWDITDKQRVTYLLEGDSNQAFRFRVTFATPIILPKKGELRFQIGIEVTGTRYSKVREIVLFGKLKLSRDFSLSFEVEYENNQIHAIRFTANFRLNPQLEIEAELFYKNGEGVGGALTLSGSFFHSEAAVFLRLKQSLQESRLETGISIPL